MKKFLLLLIFVSFAFADGPEAMSLNQGNACYKHRDLMYSIEDVFQGLKATLMQSNLNIVTVTKQDGVLTAKGNQYNPSNSTITEITVSISFKSLDQNTTEVSTIAGYNVMKKKLDTGQLGFSGVSLPIPVPLTGKYAMVGSGNIDDSLWYVGFFNSLDKIMYEEKMKTLE